MVKSNIKLLFIDDDPDDRILTIRELKKKFRNIEILEVKNRKEFEQALKMDFDVVITDYRLSWSDGIKVLKEIKKKKPHVPVLMFTASGNEEIAVEAIKSGLDDYILKSPEYLGRLPYAVKSAIEKKIKEIEVEELRKRIEDSEMMYRTLVENANDGIAIVQEGRVKFLNKRLAEMWGGSVEEMLNTPFTDYVHPDEVGKISEYYRKRLAGEDVPSIYNSIFVRKSGDIAYVEVNASVIAYKGKPAVLAIIRDVTEKKELEEELNRKNLWFRSLVEHSADIMMVIDGGGKINYISPSVERVAGYKPEELQGKNVFEFAYPDDIEFISKELLYLLEHPDEVKTIEFRAIHKDGRIVPVEATGRNLLQNPAVEGIVVNFRDITERKEAERKIKESEEKYRKMFEISPALLAILDEDGVFVEANPAMVRSLGLNPVGKSIYDILPENLADERLRKMREVIENNEMISFEDSREGREFYIIFVPIWLKGKKYCMVIAKEITEIKRMSKLLRAVNEINKHLIHEKDEFDLIKSVSEELNSLEYFLSWIGIKRGDILVTTSSIIENIRLGGENVNCVTEVLESKTTVIREGENSKCEKCEFYDRRRNLVRYTIPMIANGKARGAFVIYSEKRIADDEFDLLQTLANELAFTINTIELEKAKLKAFEQKEKNIENYAIIVDQIRNPLNNIIGLVEMYIDDEKLIEKILSEAEKINGLIKRLDEGWLESEEVRNFLKKYL
jgi:PAS domain S-box-containing protein